MDYSKGKIYVIECSITKQKYIGSTTQSLAKRLTTHIYDSRTRSCKFYNHINKYGIDLTISLIEKWPCSNKKELNKREGYHQVLNNVVKKGLNACYAYLPEYTIQLRDKIWKAKWHQDNKERTRKKSQENAKIWKINNPEKYKLMKAKADKKYREGPKKEAIKEHNKQWREENKETISEKRREERVGENRDKILKAKNESYKRNKEKGQVKVNCPNCNREMTKRSLTRHLKEACKK